MIISYKRLKEKVKVTPEEMVQINSIKQQALLATSPIEVKMYRVQMNTIINKARSWKL